MLDTNGYDCQPADDLHYQLLVTPCPRLFLLISRPSCYQDTIRPHIGARELVMLEVHWTLIMVDTSDTERFIKKNQHFMDLFLIKLRGGSQKLALPLPRRTSASNTRAYEQQCFAIRLWGPESARSSFAAMKSRLRHFSSWLMMANDAVWEMVPPCQADHQWCHEWLQGVAAAGAHAVSLQHSWFPRPCCESNGLK